GQNYTSFAATQPSPDIWAEVSGIDPTTLPACQLCDPPETAGGSTNAALKAGSSAPVRAPTRGDIGRWKVRTAP
ncbi:hypothetical protein, partial [Clostridioides difficile]|uniref:hypothetical protein n=1 Tax=Clostridioides difficile TaxID=1496 RepID=UPI001A9B0C0C